MHSPVGDSIENSDVTALIGFGPPTNCALGWDWALCSGDSEACARVLGGLLFPAPG